jgi:hypothetical protein
MKIFKQPKIIKQVHLYLSEKHSQILIVPCYYNKAGINFEQEVVTTLKLDVSDFDLGQLLVDNFEKHKYKEYNLRNFKVSDWETLKVSKSNSMNSFHEDYYSVFIMGITGDNQILRIDAYPYKDSDISLTSTISKIKFAEIGNLINRMFAICKSGQIK